MAGRRLDLRQQNSIQVSLLDGPFIIGRCPMLWGHGMDVTEVTIARRGCKGSEGVVPCQQPLLGWQKKTTNKLPTISKKFHQCTCRKDTTYRRCTPYHGATKIPQSTPSNHTPPWIERSGGMAWHRETNKQQTPFSRTIQAYISPR